MHSFTRRGLRSRRFPEVTRQEVRRFLTLNDEQQFEDLLLLRTRAAHFGAGSLTAFTALYISIILFAVPLMIESLPGNELGIPPALIPTVSALAVARGLPLTSLGNNTTWPAPLHGWPSTKKRSTRFNTDPLPEEAPKETSYASEPVRAGKVVAAVPDLSSNTATPLLARFHNRGVTNGRTRLEIFYT